MAWGARNLISTQRRLVERNRARRGPVHLLEHGEGLLAVAERRHNLGEFREGNGTVALDVEPVEGLP